jgi:hypothetical protein
VAFQHDFLALLKSAKSREEQPLPIQAFSFHTLGFNFLAESMSLQFFGHMPQLPDAAGSSSDPHHLIIYRCHFLL